MAFFCLLFSIWLEILLKSIGCELSNSNLNRRKLYLLLSFFKGELFFEQSEVVCEVCKETDEFDNLKFCEKCETTYHLRCIPASIRKDKAKLWLCPQVHERGISPALDMKRAMIRLID